MTNAREALTRSWLGHGLDAGKVDALLALGTSRQAAAGGVLLRIGERNASIFIVCSGSVRVTRPGTDGDAVVATLGRGATFGEMSAIDGSRTSSSIVAAAAVEFLEIPLQGLELLASKDPALWGQLWRNLALDLKKRLVSTNEVVDHYVDLSRLLSERPELGEAIGSM